MTSPKDVLVITTSSTEGLKIEKYLKPVSAHIVAGTNLFSDFFGGLTDVFGGRSQTYQKQLTSLYNEAIERIKFAAHELGANCIIGLNIDMDEISGKGKSMFMLTAIGTAVIIDNTISKKTTYDVSEKFENIGIERMKNLQRKREIINNAKADTLILNEENWDFITTNQISEVFDCIIKHLRKYVVLGSIPEEFYKRTINYIDALPEATKSQLLYDSIAKEDNEQGARKLCLTIEDLLLLDLTYASQLLQIEDFQKQKYGLRILTSNKPFYNKQDIEKINSLIDIIKNSFPERGIRSMKKQLLSSKEKEIWTCECKYINEIGKICGSCYKDIYGFGQNDVTPATAILGLEEKISLIKEYLR